jgi:hypothetical protein
MIPTDGSTIDVLIGNVPVGHSTYGFARADIDALSPATPTAAAPFDTSSTRPRG